MKSIAQIAKEIDIHENTLRKYTRDFSEYLPFRMEQGRKKYTSEAIEVFLKIYKLYQKRYNTNEIRDILALDASAQNPLTENTKEVKNKAAALVNLSLELYSLIEREF